MTVDISPLQRAVARLEEGLGEYLADPSRTIVREGLNQRFEFTYDLAHKMLRRVMEQSAADPAEIDRLSFPTLIRIATEQGLVVQGWPKWQEFREMRNITSHTYDESKAAQVSLAIPLFLQEVKAVAARLQTSRCHVVTATLTIGAEELAEVRAILARILPAGVRVFVFGSRAVGPVKPWSDLDLAFESEHGLSWEILGALAEAFDESRLPWRVDLIDRGAVTADFGQIIDRTKVPLEKAICLS